MSCEGGTDYAMSQFRYSLIKQHARSWSMTGRVIENRVNHSFHCGHFCLSSGTAAYKLKERSWHCRLIPAGRGTEFSLSLSHRNPSYFSVFNPLLIPEAFYQVICCQTVAPLAAAKQTGICSLGLYPTLDLSQMSFPQRLSFS